MKKMKCKSLHLNYNALQRPHGRSLRIYQWWVGGRRASASRARIIFFIFSIKRLSKSRTKLTKISYIAVQTANYDLND